MQKGNTESSVYVVDITKHIGPEYIEMCNDIARFIIIQVAIQTMLYTMNPDRFHFFTADFFMLLMFIVIGVLLYWLVFKRIVSFT